MAWELSQILMEISPLSYLQQEKTAQVKGNPVIAFWVPTVIDLELKPVLAGTPDCPTEAVHGSYLRSWPSIQQQGLSRMKRTHIHLACGLPGEDGVISGMRKNCDLAVFIDVPRALADGIEFFWSENGVLLTAGDAEGKLLPKYFTRALTLKPTRSILPLAVKVAELQMSEQA
ncbi:tRNA 2'-phosphotransferase 1 [Characodon lateralis]|uniref:tRNA 2'-phosphotransferase 1 n=1 Tax=Characodon lateralis TaxID=208331 RepID=A0ABU7CMP0_9TELE|nr:tRNA 2'-phosphotransferase 1 [Characodon lateralis]